MTWNGKPCDRCGGRKGPKYIDRKYCGKCTIQNRKDQKAAAHDAAVCRRYGLEPGDYKRLYEFQNGRCAICMRATGASRRLSTDHDHATGNTRGLLCRQCNDMLGHGRDDVLFFARVIHYLSDPPASRLFGAARSGAQDPMVDGGGSRYPSGGPDLGSTGRTAGRAGEEVD